jgi:hypothetical protein
MDEGGFSNSLPLLFGSFFQFKAKYLSHTIPDPTLLRRINLPAGVGFVGGYYRLAGTQRFENIHAVHGIVAIQELQVPADFFFFKPGMVG